MPRKKTQEPDSGFLQPSLLDSPRLGENTPEYTVSDLSRRLKRTIEDDYGHVRVRGEIGECKLHSSGHLYLSLKDEGAVLAAVCWRGQVARLGIRPETGMEVVCTGKLTTYAGQSKYQMQVEGMSLAGVGALLKMLEERRKKLAAEGLFDAARKRPLPFVPRVIGVVTSPTGAVIRDIMHRLQERFPRRVLLWPVPVQGEGAAAKIAAAIRGFNAMDPDGAIPRPDVLIVARGGGSLEDLMPFNEEEVVRAAAESRIPLISAVGHETDTTLIDYASDLRAPTPTAAAEKAVPVRAELLDSLGQTGLRLAAVWRRLLREKGERVTLLARAMGDPARALRPLMQRLDERADRLLSAQAVFMRQIHARLALAQPRHPRERLALDGQKLREQAGRLGLAVQALLRAGRARTEQINLRHPRERLALDEQKIRAQAGRLDMAVQMLLRAGRARTGQVHLRPPAETLRLLAHHSRSLQSRLDRAAQLAVSDQAKRIERIDAVLRALSPLQIMERGYSLVYDAQGRLVTRSADLKKEQAVSVRLYDGSRGAVITD